MTKQYSLSKHPEYGYFEVTPTPSPATIKEYYVNEFYAQKSDDKINDSTLEVQNESKVFYESWRSDLNNIIRQYLGNGTLEILDFGCGWCETIQYFSTHNYQCFGIDPAEDAIEHGKNLGLNVRQTDSNNFNPFEQKFDVVLLQNVLEHLANPEFVIENIHNTMLKDNGLLIIDVPNEFNDFQVAANELFGLDEWWVVPPAHLNYFSPNSLNALLEDKGFNVLDKMSSFPLEMFLLQGNNYVKNPALGKQSHQQRVNFELNLRKLGKTEVLHDFYRGLADMGLGRQILMISQRKKT